MHEEVILEEFSTELLIKFSSPRVKSAAVSLIYPGIDW